MSTATKSNSKAAGEDAKPYGGVRYQHDRDAEVKELPVMRSSSGMLAISDQAYTRGPGPLEGETAYRGEVGDLRLIHS